MPDGKEKIRVLMGEPGATRALARAWQECPAALKAAIKEALGLEVAEVLKVSAEVDGKEVGLPSRAGRRRRIDIVTRVRLGDGTEVTVCWEAKIAAPFDERQVSDPDNDVRMVAITADKELSQKFSRASDHKSTEWKCLVAQLHYHAGWAGNEGLTRGIAVLVEEMLNDQRVKDRYELARGLRGFLESANVKGEEPNWLGELDESASGGDLAVAWSPSDNGLGIQVEVQLHSHGKNDPQATVLVCRQGSVDQDEKEVGEILKRFGNTIRPGEDCTADSPTRDEFNSWLADKATGVTEVKGAPGHRAEGALEGVPACLRYGYGPRQQENHGWHGYGARLHPTTNGQDPMEALWNGALVIGLALRAAAEQQTDQGGD